MVCLTMSLPLFSQTATDTDSLIGIPTSYARQIASELTMYDLCQQERDSLKAEIDDLNSTILLNQTLLEQYKSTSDSLFEVNKQPRPTYTFTEFKDIKYKNTGIVQ